MRPLTTVLPLLLLYTGAVPGVYRHDVDPARHVELAADPAFGSVGHLMAGDETAGSAVLITREWVITAAHVVGGHRPSGLVADIAGQQRKVVAIVTHPGFQDPAYAEHEEAQYRKGLDVALLRLDRPVDAVAPIRLHRGAPPVGRTGTVVGYGTSGTAMTVITRPGPAGTRRAGRNVIDAAGGVVKGRPIPDWYLVTDFDHPDHPALNRTGSAEALPLEYLAVGGDSGGGLFVRLGESWSLAGIVSGARVAINDDIAADGLYGSLNFFTRVDAITAWIDGTVGVGSR